MVFATQRGEDAAAWRDVRWPPLLCDLLARRGIAGPDEAQAFLRPDLAQLHAPEALSDMDAALSLIRAAVSRGEEICVYGDYDADGVCATAILLNYFESVGARATDYIPSRHDEGYGLSEAAVRKIAGRAKLLITVDCGVCGAREVALAKSLGMSVVVTDHHRLPTQPPLGEGLPDCPVVNPQRGYPFPALCGAGVAFKLAVALGGAPEMYLDLAALATVADIVPLVGENRVLVALGLKALNERPRPGIAALIACAGLSRGAICADNVAYQLAPRINASGRMGDARRALALLRARDEATARQLAEELELENQRRKDFEALIAADAREQLASYDFLAHRAIVLAGEDWNAGVIGLAASRLANDHHFPVVLLTRHEDAYVGSCRSIPGVDIHEALAACQDLLVRFGGHRQAAGLTIRPECVAPFRERLDEHLRASVDPNAYVPVAQYDLDVPMFEMSEQSVRMLAALEPTGFGNPAPVFRADARACAARAVGRDRKHLRLTLEAEGRPVDGIFFGQGHLAGSVEGERRAWLYAPTLNEFRGETRVQASVRCLLDESPTEALRRFERNYPRYLRTYLTSMLYNTVHSPTCGAPRPVTSAQAQSMLEAQPRGTLLAAFTQAGAAALGDWIERARLPNRLDVLPGLWPADARAFNAASLLPAGELAVRYERLILWDAPPAAALGALPALLCERSGESDGGLTWMNELPDVDALRRAYVALCALAAEGALGESARVEAKLMDLANLSAVGALCALGVLERMHLVARPRGAGGAGEWVLLPRRKCDPANDPAFQRFLAIRAQAIGKGDECAR